MIAMYGEESLGWDPYVAAVPGQAPGPWWACVRIAIVSRRKLGLPLGRHFGVLLTDLFGDQHVVDLDATAGLRERSLAEFAGGHEVCVGEELLDWEDVSSALKRLEAIFRGDDANVYRLLDRNCEHFACKVVTGAARSRQVDSVGTLVALGALLHALR